MRLHAQKGVGCTGADLMRDGTPMATKKRGILTPAPQWWKHLRWTKRQFWKQERRNT